MRSKEFLHYLKNVSEEHAIDLLDCMDAEANRMANIISGTQWRDAKKELPKDEEAVLVIDVDGAYGIFRHSQRYHGWTDGAYTSPDVAYWMPLPPPPEGV